MKHQKSLKLLSLILSIVIIMSALPMNVFAVDVESAEDGNATTRVNALKDYSMPSNEKHAYDPFAQLESEEATKAYRESVQYVAGSIIYKVNETKGWIGGYKDKADSNDLTAMGIDLSTAQELSRKRVDNGFFKDTYEVIYEAKLDGDVWEAVDALAVTEGVVDAQPNYLYEQTAVEVSAEAAKNPDKGKQWYHSSLDVDKQWKELYKQGITPGEGTIVAVIDTGVDYTHTDLAANMWVNTAELNGKPGVDDDGNGYVDDIYGVSTVGATRYHTGDPMDDHGHGTHVAGIIGMSANNGEGGVGIAYGAKIMAIKAGQATGVFSDTDIAEAINYAVTMGADVINMSFGGTGKSFLVEEALANAFGTCVLVAAAGNDGLPTADAPDDFMKKADFYPAGYSYVLGVMATDQQGNLASFSNWDYYNNGGTAEYELAAPGVDIFSTLPGNQYAVWDGTSMAAPMVAAAAAVIRSFYPDRDTYSSRFIMGQLASATDEVVNYVDKIGEVHTYSALDIESSLNDLPTPNIIVKNTYLFDDPAIAPENDGDGIIDAGETIDLGLVLRNQWGMASNVTVKVDAISVGGVANPNIEWITDTITMENIGTFNEQNNSFVYEDDLLVGTANPIRFKVKSDTINDAHIGFNITITCTNALDKDDDNTYIEEDELFFYVQRGRTLSGTINENMTLTSADYWIIENSVYIPEGITVTVEPGTQIQFWPSFKAQDEKPIAYISVDGNFYAQGTEDAPIEMFPSLAYDDFGVDIRGGVPNRQAARHPDTQTIGNSELSYVNIINPRLNFNHGDHLNIVQSAPTVRVGFISGGEVVYGNSTLIATLTVQTLSDSKVTNLSGGYIFGNYHNVLFEKYPSGQEARFYNCTFRDNNNGGGTLHSPDLYRKPNITFSEIYTLGESKYVTVVFSDVPYRTGFEFNKGSTKYERVHQYYAINALVECRGGHLAVPNSEEELEYLKSIVSYRSTPNPTAYLIGGIRPVGEKDFTWIDGSSGLQLGFGSSFSQVTYAYVWAYADGSSSYEYHSEVFSTAYGLQTIFEYPSTVSDADILRMFTNTEWQISAESAEEHMSQGKVSSFENNAVLNNLYVPSSHWMKLTTSDTPSYVSLAKNNYWGTTNQKLIKSMIVDADSIAGCSDIITDPILTLDSPELANIYPFVTEAYITDTEGNRITSASKGQEIQIHVKFNRDMDMSVQPMVSFGPAEPYTDYVVNGAFISAREWVATTKVSGFVDAGTEFIRIKDAQAADDAWLTTGTDAARFAFEINSTGAEALTMQAVGGENKIELTWTQDDYDTLAGFNVYRSTSATGTFTKINTRIIPGTIREYVDTNVEPGKEYFYYFTVMGTDLQESPASNIAAATPIDNIKPVVTHTRVTYGNAGQALAFNVSATDNIGVEYVKIFYRQQGASNWSVLNLSNTEGSKYYGVITANNVTAAGLEYYLEVSDGTSVVRDGSAVAPIKITVDNSLAIYSVTPYKVDTNAVSEGITAMLTGVNFSETMILKVGGKQVDYTYISTTQISFIIPAGNLGRCDVELIDGNRYAQLRNALTYNDINSEAQVVAPDEVKSREQVKLPIYVTADGDVISLDIYMKLDKSLYSAVQFEKATSLGSAYAQFNCNYQGVVKLLISSTTAIDLSQPIGYLVLTPTNTVEPITTSVELTSVEANAIAVETLIDCNFVIRPNFSLSGKITYYAGGAGIAGVRVTLNNGMETYTDENGVYTFTGITTNHVIVTPHLEGCVNGAVTGTDASDILVDLARDSSRLTEYQLLAADVDGDGRITAHDAAYILQKSVGIIEGRFPGSGAEWIFDGTMVVYLTSDKTDMNFTGILLGDVTGDWSPVSEEMD